MGLDADVSPEHWDELYGWLVAVLLRMRAVTKMLRAECDDAGAEHRRRVNQLGSPSLMSLVSLSRSQTLTSRK